MRAEHAALRLSHRGGRPVRRKRLPAAAVEKSHAGRPSDLERTAAARHGTPAERGQGALLRKP